MIYKTLSDMHLWKSYRIIIEDQHLIGPYKFSHDGNGWICKPMHAPDFVAAIGGTNIERERIGFHSIIPLTSRDTYYIKTAVIPNDIWTH